MGHRVWVELYDEKHVDSETGREYRMPAMVYDCRVLSFKQILPANGDTRMKHLIQVWTDPGGMRTLSVGSIRLKDPGRQRK